ncbi:MAG: Fe-S cluster assembly protein SufD [Acidimicrobiales bacterium]
MTMATDRPLGRTGARFSSELRSTSHDPDWLTQVRREASEWVVEHGFPTIKDEDWRYTRLEPILDVPLERAPEGWDDGRLGNAVDALGADLGGTRLVFVNGHFAPRVSKLDALPEGANVTTLASALAEGGEELRECWSRRRRPYRHAFEALNAAHAEDGAFIELSPGTLVEGTIELAFFSGTNGRPFLSSPRSVILAGPGSRATVVETYTGIGDDGYGTNAVTEVDLADGAQVDHYKVQDESERAFHLASLDVHQGRASRFSSHLVSLGSRISRHEVTISLDGEEADVNLEGLYLSGGDQHHDNPVLVEHLAPLCRSRQHYRGIVDDHGHGVFNGHIVVRPGAHGTDASQSNKNLLLSDQAEVDTRPRLEIFADDVMCTHGATVGRLDENALFYLRSRGIPHHRARGLLTHGFAHEMVAHWHPAALRTRIEVLLARRLTAEADMPGTRDAGPPPGSRAEEVSPK